MSHHSAPCDLGQTGVWNAKRTGQDGRMLAGENAAWSLGADELDALVRVEIGKLM